MTLHSTEKTRQTLTGVHLWLLVWKGLRFAHAHGERPEVACDMAACSANAHSITLRPGGAQ